MRKLTIDEAERLAGKRLDHRRRYYLFQGEVCFEGRITTECSGCFEFGDYGGLAHNYPWDEKAGCRVGCGCEECGYTGKRRLTFPIRVKDWSEKR